MNQYHWRKDLISIIDVEHGLIDELFSNEVLDSELFTELVSERNVIKKIYRVTDILFRMSRPKRSAFSSALNKTQQEHVTNFIMTMGQPPRRLDDRNWPLYRTESWFKIQKKWPELIDLTDSLYGLLDVLYTENCINQLHHRNLLSKQTNGERNRELYIIMQRRSQADFKNFLKCLDMTSQQHVSSLLDPHRKRLKPLSKLIRQRLKLNYTEIVDMTLVDTEVLNKLSDLGCITDRQKAAFNDSMCSGDKATRLLDIIQRGSQSGFYQYIKGQRELGNYDISKLLRMDGVIVVIDVKTSGTGYIKDKETTICSGIKYFLYFPSQSESTDTGSDDDSNQIMENLASYGMQLLTSKTDHSIRLFFLCTSQSEAETFRSNYSSSQFAEKVQRLFNLLLRLENDVVVTRLVWDACNYSKFIQYYPEQVHPPQSPQPVDNSLVA